MIPTREEPPMTTATASEVKAIDPAQLVTIAEAARQFGVPIDRLKYLARPLTPAFKAGRVACYHRTELKALAEEVRRIEMERRAKFTF